MSRFARAVALVVVVASSGSVTTRALAEATKPATEDASAHFARGVEMFKDKDYRGALVEFRRAYELAPNYKVQYNIGKTYLELKEYAAALAALESYRKSGGDGLPADRREEVEQLITGLRKRVGRIDVTTNVPGAEVRIDDLLVGTTPLKEPLTVSAGQRRVSVFHAKYGSRQEVIEIASGDLRTVKLDFVVVKDEAPKERPVEARSRTPLLVAGITTGVLAVGTGVFGFLALRAKKDYDDRAAAGPLAVADAGSAHNKVVTFAALTDTLGLATVISGAFTLYFAVQPGPKSTQVGIGPGSITVSGAF